LTNLQDLDLSAAGVTREELFRLKSLPLLSRVMLHGVPLEKQALADLHKLLPKVTIQR
jgi:hypothetical protein